MMEPMNESAGKRPRFAERRKTLHKSLSFGVSWIHAFPKVFQSVDLFFIVVYGYFISKIAINKVIDFFSRINL